MSNRIVILLIVLAALVGCHDAPAPACTFTCGNSGQCPGGYVCVAEDNLCHRMLDNGEIQQCPGVLPDAGPADARVDAIMGDTDPEPDADTTDADPTPDAGEMFDADETPDAMQSLLDAV
jgi:hypothetical protein